MRTATIRTEHADAETVAAAVAPDNTPEMATRVEGRTVVTTIERETTSGLNATVDDYVVNVDVASAIAEHARAFAVGGRSPGATSETTDTSQRTNTNTQ